MHLSSFDKMGYFVDKYLEDKIGKKLSVMDLGSYNENGSYKPLFEISRRWKYTGVDITPGQNVDVVLDDIYNWKELKDSSFDVVISGQTFEHIEFFWLTMNEINRVLKPGGYFVIVAPSEGHLHRNPVDCWRFLCDGLRSIAKWVCMDVIEVEINGLRKPYPDGSEKWKDAFMIAMKPGDIPAETINEA